MGLDKAKIKRKLAYLWILGSFGLLDVWLRVMTRWINRYSIYAAEPNLFTLMWAIMIAVLVTLPRTRKCGRIVYGVTYALFLIYAVIQYGAYLVLDRFLWLSDFVNVGEGADYMSWVAGFASPGMFIQIGILIVVGIIGVVFFPCRYSRLDRRGVLTRLGISAACILGIVLTPALYSSRAEDAGGFNDPRLEYQRFSNSNYDLELAGLYQYFAKDLGNQISRKLVRDTESISMVDAFFKNKEDHLDNKWTGIFENKNLIVVMLESIDDWMITEEDMPILWHMKSKGISFSNMHTPSYASGYTFNTEFAFNTGVYPYSNGNVTYSLVHNQFDESIASRFSDAGYRVESYHAGADTFYNRSTIHRTLGYKQYHSYKNYDDCEVIRSDNSFIVVNDELYADVTGTKPFYSFIISFSAHLPYSDDDELCRYALEKYPQYDVHEDREVNILRAKARLTDDMFAGLLRRLEEDGALENTVIVAYADHYVYGFSDQKRLKQLSQEAGSSILERTPALIYCSDMEEPVEVDKVLQITDLAPTIMNLFGLDVPKNIMGQDAFSEVYPGYAIFPDNTWLTNTTYVKNGIVQWNFGMSNEEIENMNAYVQQMYQVNDAILNTDYYAQR